MKIEIRTGRGEWTVGLVRDVAPDEVYTHAILAVEESKHAAIQAALQVLAGLSAELAAQDEREETSDE